MVVVALFAIATLVMLSGAVERQILQVDFLQREGARRHLTKIDIPAHRGVITDRDGAILAASAPVDSVWADPRLLKPDAAALRALGKALDTDPGELRERLGKAGRGFVYLKRRAHPEEVERAMEVAERLDLPGLDLEREYRRYYPDGEVFAHIIGFTDIDDRGQEGLEFGYEDTLKGVPGLRRVIRDGRRWVVKDVESLRAPAAWPGPAAELRPSAAVPGLPRAEGGGPEASGEIGKPGAPRRPDRGGAGHGEPAFL